jgi:hypothetical protein
MPVVGQHSAPPDHPGLRGPQPRDDPQAILAQKPATGGYGLGRHNFGYWSTVIPTAFDFLSAALTPAPDRS